MNHARLLLAAFVVCCSACAMHPRITRAPELPPSTPWNLPALSAPPDFEWVDRNGPVRSLLYAGEPYGGKPTRVFAYYATPGTLKGDTTGDHDLPAMVLIHGGGGTAFREWAELWAKRGYAAIAMDLAGSRPIEGQNPHARENRTRLLDGGPDQGDDTKFLPIDEPVTEHWPYHAVSNVIKAHSLIRSFPEIDADRTGVTGISWGGYLTCIVASLDNRFRAAVPVYGCGFLHENSAWLGIFEHLGPERAKKWVRLYDPSSYLPACRVPIFFVNGTNDFAYPLDSYMKSYNLVTHAPKNIRITVNMLHSHPHGWEPVEIGRFIDQHLRAGPSLPEFGSPVSVGDTVTFSLGSALHPETVSIHVTTGTEVINKRQWKSFDVKPLPGTYVNRVVVAQDASLTQLKLHPEATSIDFTLPGAVTAWFLTVTDPVGGTYSSEVTIKD